MTDRRAPGHCVIHQLDDGRWRVALDDRTAIVVPSRGVAVALVPTGWSVEIMGRPHPPDV